MSTKNKQTYISHGKEKNIAKNKQNQQQKKILSQYPQHLRKAHCDIIHNDMDIIASYHLAKERKLITIPASCTH